MVIKKLILVFFLYCSICSQAAILNDFKEISNEKFKYTIAAARTNDNYFILDWKDKYIYRFDNKGNFQLKFGGDEYLKLPVDLETDAFSNIYVLDSADNCVKRFSKDGYYTGISAQLLYHPSDIFKDSQGRFFIADFGNRCIKVYDHNFDLTDTIRCVDEKGESFSPTAVNFYANIIFVSDWKKNCVYKYNFKGKILEVFSGEDGQNFYKIEGIVHDNDDRMYILDWGNSKLNIYSKEKELLEQKGNDTGEEKLKYPSDVKIYKNELLICDSLNKRLISYRIEGDKPLSVSISSIKVPDFPVMDIYFEENTDDFEKDKIELFIAGKNLKIEEFDSREKRVRVLFPEELVNKVVEIYGIYNYNDKSKLRFEKKIRLESKENEE